MTRPEAEFSGTENGKRHKKRTVRFRVTDIISVILILICIVLAISVILLYNGNKKKEAEEEALLAARAEEEAAAAEKARAERAARWADSDLPEVGALYSIASEGTGWTDYIKDESLAMAPAGSSINAFRCTLRGQPEDMTGTVTYSVNLSGSGWLGWCEDTAEAGDAEGSAPLEAVKMALTGELGEHYDILYSVLQDSEWTDWAMNGEEAGVSGAGKHVDGIRISVVKHKDGEPSYAGGIDPDKPMIALTFDDGPSDTATYRIVDTLAKYNVKATFFMVGKQVMLFPDAARAVANGGHEIGSHTYNHVKMTEVTPEEFEYQLVESLKYIYNATGIEAVIMRPPSGLMSDDGMAVLGKYSMPAILWSVDTEDWRSHDPESITQIILDTVQDGDIVLMHDLYNTTADAVEMFLPELIDRGFQLVTVSELCSYRGGMEAGHYYRRFLPVSR